MTRPDRQVLFPYITDQQLVTRGHACSFFGCYTILLLTCVQWKDILMVLTYFPNAFFAILHTSLVLMFTYKGKCKVTPFYLLTQRTIRPMRENRLAVFKNKALRIDPREKTEEESRKHYIMKRFINCTLRQILRSNQCKETEWGMWKAWIRIGKA